MTDTQPITLIPRAGLPPRALVVGDPARADRVAAMLDDATRVAANREYVTHRGSWQGVEVVVGSHGVGAAGAMCLFQELLDSNVRTIIRLGTAGALLPGIATGDLVIAEAAIRDDAVSEQHVPLAWPAASAPEVVLALATAAEARGTPAHRGVIWTRGVFHPGLVPLHAETWATAGAVAIEMELAALLVLASTRAAAAGGIVVIDGVNADEIEYDPHTDAVAEGVVRGAEVALDALAQLADRSQ